MHQWLKDSCFSSDNNIFISDIKVLWFKMWLCSVLVQTFFRIMHIYLYVCCPCPGNHCFVCVSCIIIIITNIETDHGCYLSIQLALNANHLFQERVLYKQRIYYLFFFLPTLQSYHITATWLVGAMLILDQHYYDNADTTQHRDIGHTFALPCLLEKQNKRIPLHQNCCELIYEISK